MASSIGDRVRSARVRAGLTQRGLDRLAGLGRGRVQAIECGARPNPSAVSLARLALALHVEIEWLLYGSVRSKRRVA